MRFFSYLFGALVLLNLVILVWPQANTSAPHLSAMQDEVNPHFIRLNKEIETRFYAKSEEPAARQRGDLELEGADSEGEVISAGDDVCYRVGPFTHQPNYELAQAVLFNAKIGYQKSHRASKELVVTRLFLGPFQRKAQVDDARVKLRLAGVLDHFVRRQESDFIISLGIYSSEQSTNAAMRLFENKISDIKRREEQVVLPESYWLHFSLQDEQLVNRQFAAMDWGEPSAKMGLHECLDSQ